MRRLAILALASVHLFVVASRPALAAPCESECTEYKTAAQNMDEAIRLRCGEPPEASSPEQKRFDYLACKEGYPARFQALGPKCDVIDKSMTGVTWQLVTAILYGATAALCWTACFYAPFRGACTAASLGAAVVDIGGVIAIGAMGNGSFDTVGTVGSGVGAAGAVASVMGPLIKATVDGVRNKAARKIESCSAAVLMTAAATLKAIGASNSSDAADAACRDIRALGSQAGVAEQKSDGVGSSDERTGKISASRGAGASGGGSRTRGDSGGPLARIDDNEDWEGNGIFNSAATASEMSPLIQHIARPGDLKAGGSAILGQSSKEIGRRLLSGEGMGSVLASSMGFPPGIADELKASDQAIREGKLHFRNSVDSSVASSAGGGGAGKAPAGGPFMPMFGAKTPAGKSDQVAFAADPKKALAEPGSDDIFHESWNGTIFQLVTYRLGKTQDRIERLEWQTPLNRALSGLPALSKTQGQKRKGGK